MTSELPMLFRHLENCEGLLHGKKVILLCDRYYASAELFLYCMLHGYRFIVRNKSYVYKDYTCTVEQDGDICVPFSRAWYRRMKRDDCRSFAEGLPALPLRVVKNRYEHILTSRKKKQESAVMEAMYLTNLDRDSFPADRIVQLYHEQRWDHETAYFDIKTHLEAERFNSRKHNIVVSEIYGKILCFMLCGRFYEAADKENISRRPETGQMTQYDYIPNMKYIADTIRVEHRLLQYLGDSNDTGMEIYLSDLVNDFSRCVVPVRPGRHYKRWGKWMSRMPTYKFRVDGRRNPAIKKCFNMNGYMTVQK